LGTLKAEYVALTQAGKEALWLKCFITDLAFSIPVIKILGDNQGSLTFAKNSQFTLTLSTVTFSGISFGISFGIGYGKD
jgi:hypothetical protein